jgi:tripartite-type tricarboxylate transporter receptor subunit TctC
MTMKIPRRQFLSLATGCSALLAMSPAARAQAYPSRPVRIIVAAPAGGPTDIAARLIGQSLSERLGRSFLVEPAGWQQQYWHRGGRSRARRRLYTADG